MKSADLVRLAKGEGRMKLFVVRIPESAMGYWGWGLASEALVRADTPERAKELLMEMWPGGEDSEINLEAASLLQVAEVNADGPAGVLLASWRE
jgi:hypothetical protein